MSEGELLHRGGEADIYVMSDKGRSCILKWYKARNAFDTDVIKKTASLDDNGIYRIREFGEREGRSFVEYDYLPGVSCSELKLPVVVALFVMRKLVKTLEVLKSHQLFHGDLNPGNVILTFTEGVLQPVLIDFGIMGPGALAYAAPERFQGKPADEKSDLYSLGMLLFRMIFGSELVAANGYDGYASANLDIDRRDISEELYASGKFTVQEISALAPLWKAMLRADAVDRAEDLDEVDELLEIALNALAVGDVSVQKAVREFAESEIVEKSRQKVPVDSKNAISWGIEPRRKKISYLKVSVLLGIVLILTILGLVFLNSGKKDVDDAGAYILEKSRNLESPDAFVDTNILK